MRSISAHFLEMPLDYLIAPTFPFNPALQVLLVALDHYLLSLYPDDTNHLLTLEALRDPTLTFWLAQNRHTGQPLGCVALRTIAPQTGEVKRLYVIPAARGQGIGVQLMQVLEQRARSQGLKHLQLETGELLAPSVRLYERCGFRPCGRFGNYPDDPRSLFLEKWF
ncbi:GNAT family N-acetyltransferase [Spirulina subsalsa CS-330]|uniref:GNAT family N-acetyltransferase n=2 Tax=Spirulinaceae TaxID=1890448 RepID=UPI00232DE548|nr:GNAT family N-acetyltransferase [Spirulina subsalsa]MDB9493995.1 GNAT family N-acetyltransferase [Spirulina subsalsa CS-330]